MQYLVPGLKKLENSLAACIGQIL